MNRLTRGVVIPDHFRKLITPESAAKMIKSNDTLAVSGFVTQGCPDRLLSALAERYEKDGEPKNLTLVFGGGPGDYASKGLNRLAEKPGLLKRSIGGHYGQVPKIAERVLKNEIAGWALPMGSISRMIRAAASHTPDHVTRVGLGTFVDPRHRGGTLNELARQEPNALVELADIQGNEYLKYKTIPIRVALIRATTADINGNLTMERESLLGDSRLMATAVRASGGIVIAQVNRIAAANSLAAREVHIPGQLVDYIIHVWDEPMGFFTRYDPARSGEIRIPVKAISAEGEPLPPLKNERLVIARRAALQLKPNDIINLGIGMPEGVARVAQDEGILDSITVTTEAGVVGGQACTGHEFGPGINFDALVEMNAQFDFYNGGGLNCAFLGMGQVGKDGSVNVSRLSMDKLTGPGGFMDIVQNTRKVIFMGTFFKKGQAIKTFQKTCGIETTFDGPRALQAGQDVLYVTERAVFELNHRGLKLIEIAPGLDLKKDVLQHLDFEPYGIDTVKVMDDRIFDLTRPLGLADHFYSIPTIIAKRIIHFKDDKLFFVNLSRLTMMNMDVVQDFTEAMIKRCLELSQQNGTGTQEELTLVLKLDQARIPEELRPQALQLFVTKFEQAYKNMRVIPWIARERLNQMTRKYHPNPENEEDVHNQTANKKYTSPFGDFERKLEEKDSLSLLWKDWTRGKRRLSRTQLRRHLEFDLSMRIQPERLARLMGNKEVITFDDFPQVVQKIHEKITWF